MRKKFYVVGDFFVIVQVSVFLSFFHSLKFLSSQQFQLLIKLLVSGNNGENQKPDSNLVEKKVEWIPQ